MAGVPEFVPARMLNEFIYCPRLFYLEWVQGEWADNHFTEDGRFSHRRADQAEGKVPEPDEPLPFVARSVAVSAPKLGISTRIDVLEGEGGEVSPIEYKRGRPPAIPGKLWDPERMQAAAQVLALRENGYDARRAFVYFVGSKEKIEVLVDEELELRVRQTMAALRDCAAADQLPPPLRNSAKCGGCSLNGICLPDEVGHLREGLEDVRLLHPARDDSLPAYVQQQGAKVGVSNEVLQVKSPSGEKLQEIRLGETSQVNVLGNVAVTTQAIRKLCELGVPLAFFSYGGWFYGRIEGIGSKNVELRRAQVRAADLPHVCLGLARRFVSAKLANSRTMLRRNHRDAPREALDGLDEMRSRAESAENLEELLGIEGNGARLYFRAFSGMLRPPGGDPFLELDFEGRNRRPPTDPINSMLSFAYALLTKEWTIALTTVGLDPHLGFYHQPRYGRPSLALDLMEEFRPIVADSVVIGAVNGGSIGPDDFIRSGLGVAMKPGARKRLIEAYERRMDQLVSHPVFDYRLSYRRVLHVQARLLSRFLLGEIAEYPSFLTR